MKRRIVRITAGVLFVLAWAGAGVYAFWGGNKPDVDKPPALDAAAMSAQIAAVSREKETASAKPKTLLDASAAKPLAKPIAKPAPGAFQRQPGAFQSSTPPPELDEDYGDPPPVEVDTGTESPRPKSRYGLQNDPPPELDVSTESEDDADPTATRPSTRFGGASVMRSIGNDQPPDEQDAEGSNTDPEPTPAAPPPSRFGGGRFGNPRADDVEPAPEADVAPETVLPDEGDEPLASPPPLATRELGTRRPAAGASATPGEKEWEGAQAPSLVIEKFAPPEVQVGKPAMFEIKVRNAGQTTARQVTVSDHVPAGTQFISAKPQPQQAADGSLVWQLGDLEAGQEQTISLELMPREEGEIGSVAHVTFAAAASARTLSTRPLLTVEHVAPAKVLIGETVLLQITISNPGTGVATGVVLQEDVPEGLTHSAGKELEYEVGTLRPGESRKLELTLEAAKAGVIQNSLSVRGDANLKASHSVDIEVVAPQLEVAMNGPKRRYLDRQATYTVSIANPGTASARDVEIVAYLPKGMKFVSTDREGQYDPQHHAVYWSLEELPASQSGEAQLVAVPIEPGEQKLRVEGHAQLGLTTSDEETVQVEAISDLVFEILDENDPIEVGAETMYQIRVTNVGSKVATNVQLAAGLPPELRPTLADGATRGAVEGQTVIFEPLGKLAPQAEATFKIKASGLKTGDYSIRVQLASDDQPTPVTKEESTRVYADR